MRKCTTTMLLLLLSLSLFAQEWAQVGTKWYYAYNGENSTGYILVESIRDSMVLEKSCKILSQTRYGWTYPGYLDTLDLGDVVTYSDNGAVYYLVDNEAFILFDISADPGYTWEVKAPFKEGQQISDTTGTVIVDSTGIEVIGNESLRVQYVSPVGGCVGFYPTLIVDGIGPIDTYLFPQYISCIVDLAFSGPLRCFNSLQLDYVTGISPSCDNIPTSTQERVSNTIQVFPNPFTDYFLVRNTDNLDAIISVFSISGKLIDQFAISKGETLRINLENDPSNLYVIASKSGNWLSFQLLVKE